MNTQNVSFYAISNNVMKTCAMCKDKVKITSINAPAKSSIYLMKYWKLQTGALTKIKQFQKGMTPLPFNTH